MWTPQQVRRFLAHVRDDRLYALYLLVVTSGLRRGEVIALRWDDLEAGLMLVQRSVVQIGRDIVEGAAKTKHSKRVVPLDKATTVALRARRRRQAPERLTAGAAWSDQVGRVFTGADGSGLVPEFVSRTFKTSAAAAGVPVIRFHDLRAHDGGAGGVSMRVVSDRSDVVDAAVVAGAVGRGDAVVTGDPSDLQRLATVLGSRLAIRRVCLTAPSTGPRLPRACHRVIFL